MPLSPHASSFTVCHATAVWRTTDKRCICSPCQFLVVHVTSSRKKNLNLRTTVGTGLARTGTNTGAA
ncbi:hypothetical protein EMIHUDRAFT_207711 [Emiliania huxleyi CCMP1516]|uniref:Secreted protein n=2 Tax=Emiliania huxleyi TaxID=2903 RepID=A0A0D3JDV7_EMIH1|nr:hypothetical protein EMIHUDRAFT_207711 [Emiliania huxleyi CCMP1516]EOD21692.1 hypothetical protein EMIHUDRAFT_207711 [Emiliania huxleyi CCMP1516]|eukprot:XP_005774121.1 hypothetical protein EMIHUDRAFT_207711 [Emiliania huxleyi CCMP1516]